MIKNVIFDFGQVLIHFDPKYMVERDVKDEADSKFLQDVIFDRLYWDKLDSGDITDEEVVISSKARLPKRLHSYVESIYYSWIYNIPEIDGMRELVAELRDNHGIRVFLLSNISEYFAKHKDEIPCLAEFEKCILSASYGVVKPSKEIFKILCDECNILPNETLFVDDSEKNIRGAIDFGIEGYLFDGNVERLKNTLTDLLSEEGQQL